MKKWLYAAGNDNRILKYAVRVGQGSGRQRLVLADSFLLGKRWPEKISPAGMDIDERRTCSMSYKRKTTPSIL